MAQPLGHYNVSKMHLFIESIKAGNLDLDNLYDIFGVDIFRFNKRICEKHPDFYRGVYISQEDMMQVIYNKVIGLANNGEIDLSKCGKDMILLCFEIYENKGGANHIYDFDKDNPATLWYMVTLIDLIRESIASIPLNQAVSALIEATI